MLVKNLLPNNFYGEFKMEKEFSRSQRVAQEMQKEIAIILQREIKDPCMGMITVSSVKISRDLACASVYVTILNASYDKSDADLVDNRIKKLQAITSFVRYLLGRAMHLRIVPELTFSYDNSLVEGMRMSNLLTNLVKHDIARHCRSRNSKET